MVRLFFHDTLNPLFYTGPAGVLFFMVDRGKLAAHGLQQRLRTIASLVPADAKWVADIGYDHGQLLVSLAAERPGRRLVGVEIQHRAHDLALIKLVADGLENLTLHLGDGFGPLRGMPVEIAIVAGMGEHRILDMVASQRGIADHIGRLIICPANFKGALRWGMGELGWRVVDEKLAWERDRYYPVSVFERGEMGDTTAGPHFGERLGREDPAHLLAYLRDLEGRIGNAIAGTTNPQIPADPRRAAYVRAVRAVAPTIETLATQLKDRP